ncbi:hypothetical protein [Bradyrhizobium sp.]|uniref:hypothetical protein n=1 Tax=Bradyrhizobium sp. TaxID=376 RepID=UPI0039E218EE
MGVRDGEDAKTGEVEFAASELSALADSTLTLIEQTHNNSINRGRNAFICQYRASQI